MRACVSLSMSGRRWGAGVLLGGWVGGLVGSALLHPPYAHCAPTRGLLPEVAGWSRAQRVLHGWQSGLVVAALRCRGVDQRLEAGCWVVHFRSRLAYPVGSVERNGTHEHARPL